MFDIRKSDKANFDSKEHFIVVREGVVFLRFAGSEGAYSMMTATADEDSGRIVAYWNQRELMDAAIKVCEEFGFKHSAEQDSSGRAYVNFGSTCEYLSDAYRVAESFFRHLGPIERRSSGADGNLYDELGLGDSGEDVYLSDGVYLKSDGSLDDRGR
ncbi:hypothetical protein QTI24_28535 [Variovorax sp. J22P240]|uniref:hypothetical protein n=1 Tax=Variovorax sp. J22P240 TaxID=3053514 RepID=UPI0025771D73|nr:hypothetical protein [Variovorax sp. J22P240]MDM0002581.1 hypothetical protein [Variovorax sp. J22P240]